VVREGSRVNLDQYEARLYGLPCVVGHITGQGCRAEELHHAGEATERNDWAQVPLCREHHQGPTGVHGLHRRSFESRYKLSDVKMLAITRQLYAKEYGA
jgi:hypothetical protein